MQITVPDENRSAIVRSLAAMIGPTLAAPGCLDSRLYTDISNRKVILLIEDWESREQFFMQLDSDKLNMLVAAIELSSEAPHIHFDSVTREDGLDAIALHRKVIDGRF
jgi:quinol monooxygenase YgiN